MDPFVSFVILGLFVFFWAVVIVLFVRLWIALKLIIRACKKYLGEE